MQFIVNDCNTLSEKRFYRYKIHGLHLSNLKCYTCNANKEVKYDINDIHYFIFLALKYYEDLILNLLTLRN